MFFAKKAILVHFFQKQLERQLLDEFYDDFPILFKNEKNELWIIFDID